MRLNLLIFTVFFSVGSFAQTYQWAARIGGSADDAGKRICADNNGFVYLSGYFKGTNVDFDPGAGTSLLSSNGDKDGFVAKYTPTGQYVWAFKIGGGSLDEAAATVDSFGNVYVTGYFRGQNVDFDPGTGAALLSSNGDNGADPGYGGDLFIAKYNSSGQYQWAFNVGGTSLGDNGTVISTDIFGNVYVGGYFRETPDFDPGSGVAILNSASGTAFVAKYDSNGQYQWAFNLGQGDVDNSPFGMTVDPLENVYLTGFFQGTGKDFDPSSGTAILNSKGSYDVFVAKYNSNGQYQWAFQIGGTGVDIGRDIEVDNSGNVYIAGDFEGSNVDFNPSAATALLSANNRDVFVAKYNGSGQYQWAKRFGAAGSDISWSLAFTNNNLYITGSYQGIINFDPSGTDNLTSSGGSDFYITKFDANGNYICAFSIGGASNDEGYRIDSDNSGNLYLTGILSSANVDFNPAPATANLLSSAGSSDVFFAKYNWPDNTLAVGTLAGNTINCNGQGQLTFTATSGNGPFTIQYTNGSTLSTQTNVQSGIPFNVIPNPTITTTYSLISVRGSEKCAAVNYPSGITAIVTSSLNVDFSYTQNSCSPKTLQFNNLTPNTTSIFWDFGNSVTNSLSQSPSITYSSFGNYPVKLRVQTSSGCTDSITKMIPVSVQADSLITGADTTICIGNSVQLNTLPALDFCWGSAPGLSSTTISNPVATPVVSTTYYFTSQSTSLNLAVNGDFSSGNTGFQSDYVSNFPNTAAAQYWVGTSPSAWWSTFPNCGDHTTATGNMMMVNGSQTVGAKVWYQTINVTPNTNYAFATWVKSLDPVSPANLRFSINNSLLGNNILASATTCAWNSFYATWNSGNSTTATILIANNNTAFSGNDFALDDISFSQVYLKQDSIKVTVVSPPTLSITPVPSICKGDTISLNATGAANYSWSPGTGLSNTGIFNPLANPPATTKYYVTGFDVAGCTKKDSITITVNPRPVISKISDTSKCVGTAGITLFASSPGATQYSWSPTTGLSDASIANPIANPANTNTYFVQVTGSNGCKNIDSVKLSVLPVPSVSTRSDTTLCSGTAVILTTTSNGATGFSWSPITGLSNPNSANPIAAPTTFTRYTVVASNGACTANAVVDIDVLPLPVVTKSNDTTICNEGLAQLSVSGGNSYLWSPSSGLTNPNISNPVASPTATTRYYVNVTGSNGCKRIDSVMVNWIPKPVFTITPVTAAICTGDSILLSANGADTYDWFSGSNKISTAASTFVKPALAQQYRVALRHNFCKLYDTLSAMVTVNNLPVVTVSKSNDIDCSNASATLTATGGVTYSWSPSINIAAANTANPVVSPLTSTTYIVKATNNNGCVKYDSVKVNVLFNPLGGGYNVPDAFTPNNDKKNDCFGIKYWGAVASFDMMIFNRWGDMVFHSNDPLACWDGNYKGIPQATGTFVYQIKAKTACGDVYKKGTILLMR